MLATIKKMFLLKEALPHRRLLTKLLIVGLLSALFITYFVVVVLLNLESMKNLGHKHTIHMSARRFDFHRQTGAIPKENHKDPLAIPRVAEYCNIPTGVKAGEEGEAPDGYQLTSVYAVIRHGDRTPMSSILNIRRPSPPQGCTMDTVVLQSLPHLSRFLFDMEMQKDRQPSGNIFANWTLYPHQSSCSSSQLTGRGALQHLLNGLALKEKYVKKWNLFGPHFSPSTQLHVRSTQLSRTYQSAIALLYAFLPQFNVSQLDIGMASNTMFCSPSFVPAACCSSLGKLKQEIDRGQHKRGKKNPAWASEMNALAKVFGVKTGQLPGSVALVDILQGHACHSIPLPCGQSGQCVTASMMERLWKLIDSDGSSYVKDSRFDRYSRTVIHSLLLEILSRMIKVSQNRSTVKFTLYSGHDLTVTPLLQALGIYDGKWPPYATRVLFELYKKMQGKGGHYIRFVLNGKDVTGLVRFCKERTVNGMCPLKLYQYFVERDNMDAIGVLDRQSFELFCKSKV